MGLSDVVEEESGGDTLKERTEKFQKEHLCNTCGEGDTEDVGHYWRCHNDSCETVVYYNVSYTLSDSLKG